VTTQAELFLQIETDRNEGCFSLVFGWDAEAAAANEKTFQVKKS
jgi:hypothetical protein